MPIYKGTEQLNPTDIFVGTQPLQRVYAGEKLVWQKMNAPEITPIKYGLLYNWYAATDARLICAEYWKVPAYSDWVQLIGALTNNTVAGGKMKETGYTYFIEPNLGATNESKFNARGAGFRLNTNGTFSSLNTFVAFYQTNLNGSYHGMYLRYDTTNFLSTITNPRAGVSIRLIKLSTTLTHGQTGTYIGNDGKVYRTICIGTQEWLADNLAETKFRNGDYIPGYNDGVYTPFTNAAWVALTTAGVCAYNNDLNNVLIAA